MKLNKNVGGADTIIRYIAVAILWVVAYYLEGTGRWVVLALSLVPLLTAVFHFCPLYTVLGLSSCKVKK